MRFGTLVICALLAAQPSVSTAQPTLTCSQIAERPREFITPEALAYCHLRRETPPTGPIIGLHEWPPPSGNGSAPNDAQVAPIVPKQQQGDEKSTKNPPSEHKIYANSVVPIESDAVLFKDAKEDIDLINQLVRLVKSNDYMCESISGARPTIFSRGYELTCDKFAHSYYIQDKGGHWVVTVE